MDQIQPESRQKRRYVLTAQGRTALLANLEKARLAPPHIVYRPTPRRLTALHANLVKALQVRRDRARLDATDQGQRTKENGLDYAVD